MARRVRFMRPAFINNRYYAAGEEGYLDDDRELTAHMEDLDTGETGDIIPGHVHEPRFLDHRSDIIMGVGRSLPPQSPVIESTLIFDQDGLIQRVASASVEPPEAEKEVSDDPDTSG
jgi:hypothetical protein